MGCGLLKISNQRVQRYSNDADKLEKLDMRILYNETNNLQYSPQIDFSLLSAGDECSAVQHLPSDVFRGYGTLNYFQQNVFHEKHFKIEDMHKVIHDFMQKGGSARDAYISQHSYNKRARRIDNLRTLNLCSVDLDIYNCNATELTESALINAVIEKCVRSSISAPSYMVHSGRGLQVKWIFSQVLPSKALTRWQAVQRYLAEEIFFDFGADIKATLATQILRLIGTTNTKSGKIVRVIWQNQSCGEVATVDFDAFASSVRPFSREEVRAFKARMKQYDLWSQQKAENRAKAAAYGFKTRAERSEHYKALSSAINLDLSPAALASIDDINAGEIWTRRKDLMSSVIDARGGDVKKGDGRHEFAWIAANALGWSNRNNASMLALDTIAWCQNRLSGYTESDIIQAASAVLKRAAKSSAISSSLYRMSEQTFKEKLGISDAEISSIQNERKTHADKEINAGAMGFKKMIGLTFEEYFDETRVRQKAAGKRTASILRENERRMRDRAKKMQRNGRSASYIASRLDVSLKTVKLYLC